MVSGFVHANSQVSAKDRLKGRGILPLKVESAPSHSALARGLNGLFLRKAGPKDLLLFTRELTLLLKAGVPLAKALSMLDRLITHGPIAGVPGELLAAITSGDSLVTAMEKHPEIFPAIYTGMIRAGDEGGSYISVLERLGDMLDRSDALNAKVRNALVYPLLVLAVTGLSLVILMVLVIPEFRPVFEEAGDRLPLSTKIIMGASDFVIGYGQIVLVGLLSLVLLLRQAAKSPRGKAWQDRCVLAMPVFGSLVGKIETARFCRSLGTLRANGVSLVGAIGIAAGTVKNATIATAVRQTVAPLSRGEGLAAPLREAGCFPPLATQLIEVGEESGHMKEMLLQVADIFDRETENSIQKLLALLSPTITIFLGCLIALIIGSILMAILGTYDLAI